METQTKKLIVFLILPLILFTMVAWVVYKQSRPDFLLHVDFLDVGQGDAIFVQTYLGNQIVIDGGPTTKVLSELSSSMPFYDRTIDLLVMTHPHEDHVTGLVEILRRYKVKKVLLPNVKYNSAAYEEFLTLIEKKGIEKIYAQEGQRIWLDNATVFDIYYPFPGEYNADKENPNDVSIVAKLSFGQSEFLFTGDAGHLIEDMLLPKYNLDADVLKVGHQGSRFSTSQQFLQEVTPEYSIIEVGENNYGHPTQQVLDLLKSSNTQVFRTDQDKTIRFVSDGINLYKK